MKGLLAGRQVNILKDDGCNTNVISKSFVNQHRHLLKIKPASIIINHSDKNATEKAQEMVMDTEIRIGPRIYKSNWIVADCRYDILLGMSWHVECCPVIDYTTGKLRTQNVFLPSSRDTGRAVTVQNIGVKKFRSIIRKNLKKNGGIEVYQLRCINNLTSKDTEFSRGNDEDPEIMQLKDEFKEVFRKELPDGLPPKRDVDHKIETVEGSTQPHRGIYQLLPAELMATKEYVTKLLKKGKIRPSKSPYGAPLFFVKQKGELRGVVDYRALNRITKHNNAPIPRPNEMFDRLGQAQFFSKLDLKTGFHQIRIAIEDIEKTAFKTKYGHFEFLVMPMGLRNAPATFQALMNAIFRDCIDDFIVIYLDDILIFSDSRQDHLRHLRIVLSRLKEHQLYVGSKNTSS